MMKKLSPTSSLMFSPIGKAEMLSENLKSKGR
ncbi:hypothetical protein ACOMICROBIO_FLGHMIGD_03942 [Vibrio sp. B1FLJ16]|nr:hypothetical protein ACOMICROBIO_FLGHMIGD_03942 [Vibrio sp. B1FLJ16]CAE6939159.1 hypothetical protein ACOMICROBIO_FLGHMIGD_03942 [Vibrio sp. B1FLJ16]